MMTSAITAHAAWRCTKCQVEWAGPICAMIAEALYTISTPENTMPSTVKKRIQSVLSLCAISMLLLQLVHNLFEEPATVFVALKLVETGARGREQNGIAGSGVSESVSDRGFDVAGVYQAKGTLELPCDFGRGGANQQGRVRLGR